MSAENLSVILALLVPIVTYCLIKMKRNSGEPPTASHWFPLLSHTRTFALGDITLASAFLNQSRNNKPVQFRGIGFDFILVSGTNLIRKALTTDSHLDWNHTSAQMFGRLFNAPKKICDATAADDSGVGAKPYPGSSVQPGRRLIRNQVLFFNDAFSKKSMDELVPRFLRSLEERYADFGIGEDWVDLPDLYVFLRDFIFRCGIASFYGHNMLDLNPDIEKNFTEFDDNVQFLATGLPRWMKPRAFESRAKCLAAVKRWRQEAVQQSKGKREEDSEWDRAWGLGAIKRRNKLFEATNGLFDEDATAASDLATMWAFTSNVIPATFWFLFEMLRDEDLYSRAKAALDTARNADGSWNTTKIINDPLLQSTYAEVLRLHTASMLTRAVKKTHELDSWILKRDQTVVVSSHVEHRSSFWNTVDSSGRNHPPGEFWAERFLIQDAGAGPRFSVEGMQGKWMPYGMGEHMCPGRHFAKYEMLLSFAALIDRFEIELLGPKGWKVDDDLGRYGFGAVHPKQKVGARIRRRH